MNYLGRPIFPFVIDWSTAIQRSITYDRRTQLLGFGAEFFTGTATYDVTGWEFGLHHENPGDIIAFECFADSLVGRLKGFWLPCPLQAAEFMEGFSARVIGIRYEALGEIWAKRPDQFLLFTFPDGSQAAAQIQGVAMSDASDDWPADIDLPINAGRKNLEYICLTANLPQVPGPGTVITRLHYVRFAQDTEELQMQAEGIGSMAISVVELPLEYTQQETGLQPIYLYQVFMRAPVAKTWYYTSFAAAVVSGGQLYQPWPMTHGSIKQTTDGNSNPVSVSAKYDPTHPFSFLGGTPPGAVMYITIMRCYIGAPENAVNIFAGFVDGMDDGTDKVTASCQSRLYWLHTKLPRFYVGTICNWVLYDPTTCGVGRGYFETTVTIQQVVLQDLPQLKCFFNFDFQLANWQTENWFQGGTLEVGNGVNYELRSIIASEWIAAVGPTPGYLLLTLNQRLKKNGVNAQCQITAGCDHTADGPNGCMPKFNNFANFGAFVDVPDDNLSLKGINTSNAAGGKKS